MLAIHQQEQSSSAVPQDNEHAEDDLIVTQIQLFAIIRGRQGISTVINRPRGSHVVGRSYAT
jgi:hypothetical protein